MIKALQEKKINRAIVPVGGIPDWIKILMVHVEVVLLKSQVSKFKLRQRIRRLEYEGIHLVCFGYGLYGHKMDSYPLEQKEPMAAPKEGMENDLSDILAIRDKEMLRKDDNFINPKILETYGSWMLATWRSRFTQNKKDSHNKDDSMQGKGKLNDTLSSTFGKNNQRDYSSRFVSLSMEEEEEDTIPNHSVDNNHQRLTDRFKNPTLLHSIGRGDQACNC